MAGGRAEELEWMVRSMSLKECSVYHLRSSPAFLRAGAEYYAANKLCAKSPWYDSTLHIEGEEFL